MGRWGCSCHKEYIKYDNDSIMEVRQHMAENSQTTNKCINCSSWLLNILVFRLQNMGDHADLAVCIPNRMLLLGEDHLSIGSLLSSTCHALHEITALKSIWLEITSRTPVDCTWIRLYSFSMFHVPAASAKFQRTINTCICQLSLTPLSACMNIFMKGFFSYSFVIPSTVVYTNITMRVQSLDINQYFTCSALCVHTCTDVACRISHWRTALLVQLLLLVHVQA